MRRGTELSLATLLVRAYIGPLRRGVRNLQGKDELFYRKLLLVYLFLSSFKVGRAPMITAKKSRLVPLQALREPSQLHASVRSQAINMIETGVRQSVPPSCSRALPSHVAFDQNPKTLKP
jgi:hypothetical protein